MCLKIKYDVKILKLARTQGACTHWSYSGKTFLNLKTSIDCLKYI